MVDKYHRHEALHMAWFFSDAVSRELCKHPAIKANPKLLKLAEKAEDSLSKLYQAIGREG